MIGAVVLVQQPMHLAEQRLKCTATIRMKVLLIALILGIVFIIAYVIFKFVYKPWSVSSMVLMADDVSLDKDQIYPFLPTAATKPSHTFTFYVMPTAYNRTGSTNAFYSIFSWSEFFMFGIVPGGASTSKDTNTGTVLKIKNNGSSDLESVICPPIPLQKWTYVAITIEGRRVDVMYNGRIVASQLLSAMPAYNMTGTVRSGSANLKGRIGLVGYNNRRMDSDDIMIDYVSTSNTRGEPYFGSMIPVIGNLFSCPAGAFCMKPSAPPSPGTMAWYTPYA
jgi:hypothetical protein